MIWLSTMVITSSCRETRVMFSEFAICCEVDWTSDASFSFQALTRVSSGTVKLMQI